MDVNEYAEQVAFDLVVELVMFTGCKLPISMDETLSSLGLDGADSIKLHNHIKNTFCRIKSKNLVKPSDIRTVEDVKQCVILYITTGQSRKRCLYDYC